VSALWPALLAVAMFGLGLAFGYWQGRDLERMEWEHRRRMARLDAIREALTEQDA